jgi:hypothetical protein
VQAETFSANVWRVFSALHTYPVSSGTYFLIEIYCSETFRQKINTPWECYIHSSGWVGDNQGDRMSLWKNRPKCSPTHFGQNQRKTSTVEEKVAQKWGLFLQLSKICPWVNIRPIWSPCADNICVFFFFMLFKRNKYLFFLPFRCQPQLLFDFFTAPLTN